MKLRAAINKQKEDEDLKRANKAEFDECLHVKHWEYIKWQQLHKDAVNDKYTYYQWTRNNPEPINPTEY